MKQRIIIFLLCIFSVLLGYDSFAAINFTVTPIRYEITMNPGETKTFSASIKNNGSETVVLPTSTSDFTARDNSGVPHFIRKSELVFPEQELSSWIELGAESVTVEPGQEVTIPFTIRVPNNATPGGHYAAVFFNNPNSNENQGGIVGINVDYGILVLLTVSGEIRTEAEIGEPSISYGSTVNKSNTLLELPNISFTPTPESWYLGEDETGKDVYQIPDSCPVGDFSPSRYDGICISFDIFGKEDSLKNKYVWENGFEINFDIPIKNIGNSHIKPVGKVILRDENGNVINAIGRESIINEEGANIGDKIVDYIPINDEGGNILPQTNRTFSASWKGFPYKTFDEEGNPIISYWNPGEYYTNKNKQEAGFLMPWERVSEVRQNKKIFADIELSYKDENGENIEFNTAKEFKVQYIEQKVTLNPYIILGLLLLGTAGIMIWFGIRWWILVVRKRRCWKCKEIIKAHWETCPYCKTLQNKNEHRRFEKQQKTTEEEPQKREISQKKPVSLSLKENKTKSLNKKEVPQKDTPKRSVRPLKAQIQEDIKHEAPSKKPERPKKEKK